MIIAFIFVIGAVSYVYTIKKNNQKLKLEIMNAQKWQLASEIDALTGIYNRGGGEIRIKKLIENGGDGLFCLFDIDSFKKFIF